MARYFDLEILKEMVEARAEMLIDRKVAFLYVSKWFDKLPAADVQEVKHAHWIVDPDEGTAWCSSCRDEFEDNGDTIPDYWYYCPHCGAKMDEEDAK